MDTSQASFLGRAKLLAQRLKTMYPERESENISKRIATFISGMPWYALLLKPGLGLSKEEEKRFNELEIRLLKAEPLQYVIGKAWFRSWEFEVNPHVLIPRPETEELVELAKKELSLISRPFILDLGTGSGCIAISLALEIEDSKVYALEISNLALETAKRNAQNLGAKAQFHLGDILAPNLDLDLPLFDLVISNPPYIMEKEKEQMAENVLNYEPHLALFPTGNDPLIYYRTIAGKAFKWLKPGGLLLFELNESLGMESLEICKEAGFIELKLMNDFQGKVRFLRGNKPLEN